MLNELNNIRNKNDKGTNLSGVTKKLKINHKRTYFLPPALGGGIGVRDEIAVAVDVGGNEICKGKEICFLARGGGGGNRSELDETFERVSSFDVLVLSRNGL